MHIVYLDESGNTGNRLDDKQQPVFVLAALIVPEESWNRVERSLAEEIERYFPEPRPEDFEIHATALRNGDGCFKEYSVAHRIGFRDAWLKVATSHGLRLIYRAIVKNRYAAWMQKAFGSGVKLNPHVVAFPLVAQVVNEFLKSRPGSPLGMFVFDDNKEVVHDVEKSLQILRGTQGVLRLSQIIEKGFFIDSSKSLLVQLCDICAYQARKKEEALNNLPMKPIDEGGITGIEPLLYRGNEAWQDVIAWITEQQKKERPGS